MPKLNRPPKLCQKRNLAIVYIDGKRKLLGLWGSDEAKRDYSRIVSEWKPSRPRRGYGAHRRRRPLSRLCRAGGPRPWPLQGRRGNHGRCCTPICRLTISGPPP